MFCPETALTSVARLFVSMLVAFSYPLLVHPGRNSMLGLWRGFDSEDDLWLKHHTRRYVILTVRAVHTRLCVALSV